MEAFEIKLVNGRAVTLGDFYVRNIWADVAEGTPELLAKGIRHTLPGLIRHKFGETDAVIIFDDDKPTLPDFLCMAYFKSSSVKPGYFYSYIHVVWFIQNIDVNMLSATREVLERFDWDAYAKDVHINEY